MSAASESSTWLQRVRKKIPAIILFWFDIVEEKCDESENKLCFRCRTCPDVERCVTLGTGWMNVKSHLEQKHKDYEETAKECNHDQSKLESHFCTKTGSMFGWLELIVEENLPISFVTKKKVRNYMKLEKISRNTFMKYAQKVSELVEREIKLKMPEKIGIVFDGWTESGKHFVALFARYLEENEVQEVLLACSPLEDETDLGAESHVKFINDTLSIYGKTVENNVLFICGDNASTNQAIAAIFGKPFIGCYSHKFNLAMQKIFEVFEEYIERIADVMKLLKGVKRRAALEEKGAKKLPILRNSTRWSSTYQMLERYFDLLQYMDMSDQELMVLIPLEQSDNLRALLGKLDVLNDVTIALQANDLTLLEAMDYFKETLNQYPNEGLEEHLSPDGRLVKNKVFEAAVYKVLNNEEEKLTDEEKKELKDFENDDVIIIENPNEHPQGRSSSSRSIVGEVKRRKIRNRSKYINLKIVCPTSNCVERFFSLCGIVWSKLRRRLLPKNLEMLLFLKMNRRFWDKNTVRKAIAECGGTNAPLAGNSDNEADEDIDYNESGDDNEEL
jgi:hypothetical protein